MCIDTHLRVPPFLSFKDPMFRPDWLIAFAMTTVAATAAAQAPAAAERGNSASPPTLSYESALEKYQPFKDEELLPWKEANDNVARIGGWRAYAREARPEAGTSQEPAAGGSSGSGSPGGADKGAEHHKH